MHIKIRWEKEINMKVLIIMNSTNVKLGGGIIQIILNYKAELDNENISQTYAINCIENSKIPELLSGENSDFVHLPNKKKNMFKYCVALYKIMHNSKFDVVHVHGNSANMLIELLIAKINKIQCRIAHCHNSTCNHKILNEILKPIFKRSYTMALACSNKAGDWIFGKNNYNILNNAIDLNLFKFSEKIRQDYRKKLNINENTKVIGNVGNLNEQKNQEFLIRIFEKYTKINKDSILIIIGEGINKSKLEQLAAKLKITPYVKFLGVRSDVNCWLQAMDLLVFPSKWEGFGMALIEAQATGLPILSSNVVPKNVNVTKTVHFLDLNKDSIDMWVKDVDNLLKRKQNRKIDIEKFKDFDIKVQGNKLVKYYEKNINKEVIK